MPPRRRSATMRAWAASNRTLSSFMQSYCKDTMSIRQSMISCAADLRFGSRVPGRADTETTAVAHRYSQLYPGRMDGRPAQDADPSETNGWVESFDAVIRDEGPERARYLLQRLTEYGQRRGVVVPFTANTPYVNTIPVEDQPLYPGDRELERRIKNLVRWNAAAMVM